MASIEELRDARLLKINKLKEAGMNPYPSSVPRTCSIKEVKESFEILEKEGKNISVAGRVMIVRGHAPVPL